MIFLERKCMAEVRIGLCPICDKEAQVINSRNEIELESSTLCNNEYYTHYVDSSGMTYIKKKKYPKRYTL